MLENCTLVETDRCFEYSILWARISGDILSFKNPSGSIGELILDENCLAPGACRIITISIVV